MKGYVYQSDFARKHVADGRDQGASRDEPEAAMSGGEPEEKSGRISYTHPVSLGDCLLESLDDITAVLAAAEGEGFK